MTEQDRPETDHAPTTGTPSPRTRRLRRWGIGSAVAVGLYALAGFLLAPYLVQRYVPQFAAETLQRQAEVGEVRINPFVLTFEARDLALREADGRPILALDRLFVDLEAWGLFRWAWAFAEIRVEGPDLHLVLGADGRLNLARLGDAFPPDPDAPPPEADAAPPRLVLEKVVLQDGGFTFTDETLVEAATAEARQLNLELSDISTLPENRGPYGLRARLPSGGEIAWRGELALNPITSSGTLRVSGLTVAGIWPLLHVPLRVAEPAGEIDLELDYRLAYGGGTLSLGAEPIDAALRGFALRGPDGTDPTLELDALELAGARFDLQSRELLVPALTLRGGRATGARDANGQLDWAGLLIPTSAAPGTTPSEAVMSTETEPSAPWTVRVEALAVEEFGLAFHDAFRRTPLDVSVAALHLGLRAEAHVGADAPELTVEGIELALEKVAAVDAPGETLLALDAIRLAEGRFDLAGRSFTATELATTGGRFSASVDADGTLNWAAPPPGAPASAAVPETASDADGTPWTVDLASVRVDDLGIDFSDASRAAPVRLGVGATRLALRAHAEFGGTTPQMIVEEIGLDLNEVAMTTDDGKPVIDIDTAVLESGRVDLAARRLEIARVRVDGGRTRFNRGKDGRVRELDALSTSDRGKLRRELDSAIDQASAEGTPWSYAIGEVAVDGFSVGYSDAVSEPAVAFDFTPITLKLADISNDGSTPIRYDGRLQVRQGGVATVRGQVALDGASAKAAIALDRLALAPLAPLLSRIAALELDSGTLSSKLTLDYAASGKGPKLKTRGGLSLRDLLIRESISGDRFLAWKALDAEGIALQLEPDGLTIDEVRLAEPGAKIVIFEDRTVNLVRVFDADGGAETTPTPEQQAEAAESDGFPVRVKRVRVDDGTVDFADLSLVLPFAAEIHALGGDVTGLAPGEQARATLALEGQVGDYGQARVDGSLAPFAPKAFADVTVTFRNVEMSPLSPYTATFAGRKIASGKLDLDLEYKLEQSELLGDNRVVLREFTLGEQVASPDAANLPLDLAVALLSDSSGKIQATLPVRGNVDHPEFSYGGIIGQAIANLIGKIVTAPFRALGAVLGDADGEPDTVRFAAGRSTIAPPEREQLARVAEALAARPQLALTVSGAYATAADGHALAWRDLALALAAELDEPVAAGDDPPPPDFAGAGSQLALEKLARERLGKEGVDAFAAQHAQQTGTEVKRVNPIAGRLGRASPDAVFYAALFDALVERAPPGEERLLALARARAAAVVETLAGQSGLAATRLVQGEPVAAEAGEQGIPVTLDLGVHKEG